MAKLNKKISLRLSDRFAVGVALALALTATTGLMEAQTDGPLTAQEAQATTVPHRAEQPDPTSDDATSRSGLAARFLLFRRG